MFNSNSKGTQVKNTDIAYSTEDLRPAFCTAPLILIAPPSYDLQRWCDVCGGDDQWEILITSYIQNEADGTRGWGQPSTGRFFSATGKTSIPINTSYLRSSASLLGRLNPIRYEILVLFLLKCHFTDQTPAKIMPQYSCPDVTPDFVLEETNKTLNTYRTTNVNRKWKWIKTNSPSIQPLDGSLAQTQRGILSLCCGGWIVHR